MATYAIGDIQGCFRTFEALLGRLSFRPGHDRLWLAGDVVNRGPDSLAMLRWAKANEGCLDMVLGNHDLALLALAAGVRAKKPLDTLDAILAAPDAAELLAWLRRRPLLVAGEQHLMVHAGVLPGWCEAWLLERVGTLEAALADAQTSQQLLAAGLDKKRGLPTDLLALDDPALLRVLTNVRAVDGLGAPDFGFKGPPELLRADQRPWFSELSLSSWPRRLVTGHWAALGLRQTPRMAALDSGCVWGGCLTAMCLEDHRIVQQKTCEQLPLAPDGDG